MAHVTKEQRYVIASMLKEGYNITRIAEVIDKHKSVVSREIARNRDGRTGEYRSDLAQRKTQLRHRSKNKQIKLTAKHEEFITKKLKLRWSPEQISKAPNDEGLEMVSHERIYQYVLEDKRKGGDLHKYLRRKKKYGKRVGSIDRRGKIANAVNISKRPQIVEDKERFGDFEVDLMVGANHKGFLLTMNDRASGWSKVRKLTSKNSDEVAYEMIKALKPCIGLLHTITADNGKEFAGHEIISAKLGIDFYFANPYSSWERGANENYNGLLRDFFPKKTNFEKITKSDVQRAERLLNDRPRKRLGYKTPRQMFKLLTKVAFTI